MNIPSESTEFRKTHLILGKFDSKDNKRNFFSRTMNQYINVRPGLQNAIVISGDDLLQILNSKGRN